MHPIWWACILRHILYSHKRALLLESTEFWIVDFSIQQTQPTKQRMPDYQVEIHHHHHHHQPNLETGKDDQVIWVWCLNTSSLTDSDTDNLFLSLDFRMPDGRSKDGEPRTTTISFPFDVHWDVFYDCVCHAMGLSEDTAQLGWKGCDEKKKDPFHKLENAEDLSRAFDMHRSLLQSNRRMKPVFADIADLVYLYYSHAARTHSSLHRLSVHKNLLKNQKRLIQLM